MTFEIRNELIVALTSTKATKINPSHYPEFYRLEWRSFEIPFKWKKRWLIDFFFIFQQYLLAVQRENSPAECEWFLFIFWNISGKWNWEKMKQKQCKCASIKPIHLSATSTNSKDCNAWFWNLLRNMVGKNAFQVFHSWNNIYQNASSKKQLSRCHMPTCMGQYKG